VEQTALGPDGSLYAADPGNHVILKIARDGIVSIVAGNGLRRYSGDGVPARATSLNEPRGIAVDRAGNLYIADSQNHRVRMVDTRGIIRTVAGNGFAGDSGDNGPAASAALNTPCSVALDNAGNLFIDDRLNSRIRRVGADGVIRTVLRVGTGFNTGAIAADPAGNILVPDALGNRILRIDSSSLASIIIAGTGVPGFSPDGTAALSAMLNEPSGVAVDAAGVVYFTDRFNQLVRKIENGVLGTVAGNGDLGFDDAPVPAAEAKFNSPYGLAFDGQDDLVVADLNNRRLRRIARSGNTFTSVSLLAGNGQFRFFPENSPATLAFLTQPRRAVAAADGSLYVTDTSAGQVRRIDAAGRISSVTARLAPGATGCSGEMLQFDFPIGLALHPSGVLYVSDYGSDVVIRVNLAAGTYSRFAGTCFQRGFSGERVPALSARLNSPSGLTVDAGGNVYIADTDNHAVRRVGLDGIISTVAGVPQSPSQGVVEENVPATMARLAGPHGVVLDTANNLYIADRYNERIRRVSAAGVITTVAGGGSGDSLGDNGPARQARLFQPWDVAVDRSNNLLIADTENQRIRLVRAADGIITTAAGNGIEGFSGDGGPATAASLNYPTSVIPFADGSFVIVDSENDRLRRVAQVLPVLSVSQQTIQLVGVSGGRPQIGSFQVTSTVPGLPFQASANQPWLSVSLSASTLPATVDLTASLTGLPVGEQVAEVRITAPPAAPITVTVRLQVGPAQTARLDLDLSTLLFTASGTGPGGAQSRSVRLSNAGSGSTTFLAVATTESEVRWLSVRPESGSVSAASDVFLTVTADPTGLAPGTYKGSLRIQPGSGGDALIKPVVLTVSQDAAVRLTQSGLTFYALEGSAIPQTQTLEVVVPSSGSPVRAAVSTMDGNVPWISLTPVVRQTGSPIATVAVRVDPTGLAIGNYYAEILFNADNSPLSQSSVVVLQILPRGTALRPLAQPSGLVFTSSVTTNPPSQELTLFNPGTEPLRFNSNSVTLDGMPWIVYQPPAGEIAPGQRLRLAVQPIAAGLREGVYRGAITFLFSSGPIQVVPLAFIVTPPDSGTPVSARFAGSCTPNQLVPVFNLIGRDFVVPTGWPTPVEVRVLDNCGQALTDGAVTATFTNGDAPLSLSHVRDGIWSATWVSRNSSATPTGITATAEVSSPARLTGAVSLTGLVRSQQDVPIIPPGAVFVAGNSRHPNLLAPGSLTSIYGVGLSSAQQAAQPGQLPGRLSGTSVAIGGRVAPLSYVSEGQVNAMMPYEVPPGSVLPVVLRRQGAISVPQSVSIAAATPSVFLIGPNQPAAVTPDGQLVSAERPARSGGIVILYCAGLGAVTPGVATGDPAPGGPLAVTAAGVEVDVGGRPAAVQYAGLTPGFAGLYQLNLVLPDGLAGPSAPVTIRVAGQMSVPVELAIQ
jgi:uncharacterized protein (TIGR03437 family)